MRPRVLSGARPAPSRQGPGVRSPLKAPSGGGLRPRDLALATAFYTAATLLLSYPLALGPATLSRFDNGDARLNAWALSWVAHQLPRNPLRLFEANTFYPLPHTLAFSEHLFLPAVLALPLLRLSNDLVLTYNLLLLLAMISSALGMYVLTASLTGSRIGALFAGLFFSFAPYRFDRLPHLQLQFYGFLPLALACLHRFFATGSRSAAFGFAGLFLLQALSGTYLAAMAAVASGVALATLARRAGLPRRLAVLALAIGLASAALYPFARPYLWVNRTLGVEWDLLGIGSLSATPASYLASSSHLYRGLTQRLLPEKDSQAFLFPGLAPLLLGLVGTALLLAGKGGFARPRATVLCYLGILASGFLLSLGPGTFLHPLLYETIIFFKGLRALSRFALLPLLSLSLLSGYALAWLFEGRSPVRRRLWAAALVIFFVAESTAAPYAFEPFRDQPPPVYGWLGSEAKPGPLVELPFRVLDTRYMFWARHHGFRPTLNGDSGFIPASHQWMKIIFQRFPSPDSIALLQRLGVRYVVVHLGAFRETALVRLLNGLAVNRTALLPARDFGRDLVFEVLPAKESPPEAPQANLLSYPAPARPAGADTLALFDGQVETPWKAAEPVAEIEIRLDRPWKVSGLILHYGPEPRSPVDRVEMEIPDGNDGWTDVWSTPPGWPALADLVLGLLARPRDGTQTLSFAPFAAEAIRLRLRGFEAPPQIAEIEVLGAPSPAGPS